MTKIKVKLGNIGGIKSLEDSIETGKVNKVDGASASGKSSFIRGINLAVVGTKGDDQSEFDSLHAETLMRGENTAKIELNINGGTTVSLAESGLVRSNKSPKPKAIYTTLLSSSPPSKLYRSIYDPDNFDDNEGDPNNFTWIVDELSEAGQFQTWGTALHGFNEEMKTIRTEFEEWKRKRTINDERKEAIMQEIKEINQASSQREDDSREELAPLKKDKAKADSVYSQRLQALSDSSTQLETIQAKVAEDVRKKEDAEGSKKIAKRRLDDAQDLLENPPIEPNVEPLNNRINALAIELASVMGADADATTKEILNEYSTNLAGDDYWNKNGKQLATLLDKKIAEMGDGDKAREIKTELDAATAERNNIVSKHLEDGRKFGRAQQQADAARADIKNAENNISVAESNIKRNGPTLPILEKREADDRREFEAATKDRASLTKQIQALDNSPEAKAEEEQMNKLETELVRIPNTVLFPVRFVSLGMMAGEARPLEEDVVEALLNPTETAENQTFVRNNLNESPGSIRSLLKGELDSGVTAWLAATTTWVAEEVERQRSETRRIFNSQGSELFAKLKFSPITSVALNTDYELQITWQNGSTTGLKGSGGERMIIAASLLIAMHKAYTPEIPILMFDGVLGELDPEPREELLSFLSEYAAEEDIAIVASELVSETDKVSISQM